MRCARVQLTDYDAAGRTTSADLAVRSAPLTPILTSELDGAAEALGVRAEEILLASLGRAIERTIGGGLVTVDVTDHVTGHVTAPVAPACQPITVNCAGPNSLSANEMLFGVHHALSAAPARCAPHSERTAEVLFVTDEGDAGSAGMGHRLEVHARRCDDVLILDWWFDAACFEPYSVEELAEQLPHALIELTSEATAPLGVGAVLAMAF